VKSLFLNIGILLGLISPAITFAAVVPLLKSDSSWEGGSFSYPEGDPEIISVKLLLEEGKDAPFHCHPVPTMGYISKGEVLLETEDGQTRVFKQGDSVVEVMKTVHRGKSIKGDVEIIVFYAGAKDLPVTVLPKDKESFAKYCSKR